jgi:alpha-tubulin suppressor-like RCC1 family protein
MRPFHLLSTVLLAAAGVCWLVDCTEAASPDDAAGADAGTRDASTGSDASTGGGDAGGQPYTSPDSYDDASSDAATEAATTPVDDGGDASADDAGEDAGNDASPPANSIAELSGGRDFMCARRVNGEVWCWGSNVWGTLGQGGIDSAAHPTPIKVSVPPATKIVSGGRHVCILSDVGDVWCWGWNAFGQLGHDKTADITCTATAGYTCNGAPTKVAGLGVVGQLTVPNMDDTCVVDGPGGTQSVKCFGMNYCGEVGHLPAVDPICALNLHCTSTPSVVAPSTGPATADYGSLDGYFVKRDGIWQSWGCNSSGQLAIGSTDANTHPNMATTLVPNDAAVRARGSNGQVCFVTPTGAASCWGANSVQRAGLPASTSVTGTPTDLGLTQVVDVALASESGCAITLTGATYCWATRAAVRRASTRRPPEDPFSRR